MGSAVLPTRHATRPFPLNSGRLTARVNRRIVEELGLKEYISVAGRHEASRWRQDVRVDLAETEHQ